MKEPVFNGDGLRFKSLEDYVAFKSFHDFVNNKNAIDAHLKSYEYYATDPSLHEERTDIMLGNQKTEDIISSLNHFGGLTLTSLCTTFEIAIKEFLCCYFFHNPKTMYGFLGRDDSKGMVSLNDMLTVNTYQALIVNLATKSASKASKGTYVEAFSRVGKLCKANIDKEVLTKLNDLQTYRNKIVHEKFLKQWTLSDISDYEVLVSSVIEEICRFGIAKNIPGKYTCVSGENRMELASVAVLGKKEI